jgi:hypothetical protein
MRRIGFRSNILFAIAAAFGVIAALDRSWYGPAPVSGRAANEVPLAMEDFFSGIGRAFSSDDGISGWQALESADRLIAGLAVATVLLLVLTMIPALQFHVQMLARWTSLAALGVIVVKLVDEPGANAFREPRQGLMIALGSAAVLVASTLTVADAPARRRAPVNRFVPPPPPAPPDSEANYGPQLY